MALLTELSSEGALWRSLTALSFSLGGRREIKAVSPALLRLLSASDPDDVLGRPVEDLFRDGEAVGPLTEGLAENGEVEGFLGELATCEGDAVPVEITGVIPADGVGCFLVRDLRADPAVLRAHRAEHDRLRELVEHAADIVYRTDRQGRFTYINPAGARLLGWLPEQLLDMEYAELVSPEAKRDVRRFYARQLRDLLANTYLEVPIVTRDRREIWLGQNVQLVFRNGGVVGYQAVAREITDRKHHEEQLAHRATHDSLTGLFNRSFFEAQLDKKIAECVRHGSRGAVLVVDLDRFKEVNDRFGHGLGDAYLAGFAELLTSRFRESDVVARLGGDEFAVLLDRPRMNALDDLASELLARIRHYAATADERASTTASIGIALFPDHGTSRDDVMARADYAMYQAKELGRNRYSIYQMEDEALESEERRSERVRKVRGALDRRDFRLFAQPLVDLRHGELFAYEVLLRLKDSDGNLLEAGSFLDLAERFGSIQDVDLWVVDNVFDILGSDRDNEDLAFGVNLSSRSIGEPAILDLVEKGLARTGITPSRLIFEINESAAVADLGRAIEFMGALAELGCRFALDDFGIGFSSLYRLKQLPVDFLKIDGNFVRDLAQDRADQALVRAIVEVANVLEKKTIAEFVEDGETLTALEKAGVDYAQGYHVGRAEPIEELLSRRRAVLR